MHIDRNVTNLHLNNLKWAPRKDRSLAVFIQGTNIDTKEVVEYPSFRAAARAIGGKDTTLRTNCSKGNAYMGFIWKQVPQKIAARSIAPKRTFDHMQTCTTEE